MESQGLGGTNLVMVYLKNNLVPPAPLGLVLVDPDTGLWSERLSNPGTQH